MEAAGLTVSVLDSESSSPSLSPDSLTRGYALLYIGQDTLLSQCLSPPRCKMGSSEFNAGGSCDGLVSHPVGSINTYSHLMLQRLGQALAVWATGLMQILPCYHFKTTFETRGISLQDIPRLT